MCWFKVYRGNYSDFSELCCKQKEDLKTKVERIVHEYPYVHCLDSTINIFPHKTTVRDHDYSFLLEKFLRACRAPENTRGRGVLS